MLDIERLARDIVAQQSFSFSSFAEAKCTIKQDAYYCTFDRLSLQTYTHNMPRESFSKVSQLVHKMFSTSRHIEDNKKLAEYCTLFSYAQLINNAEHFVLKKEEHPDFVLCAPKKIGIEITVFTRELHSVLARIANEALGQGKNVVEVKQHALSRHKGKANNYAYYDLDGSPAVGVPLYNIKDDFAAFAKIIIKKYHLYKDQFSNYDEFILLCDARARVSVSNETDIQDIVALAQQQQPDMKGYSLHILWQDSSAKSHIYKKIL